MKSITKFPSNLTNPYTSDLYDFQRVFSLEYIEKFKKTYM